MDLRFRRRRLRNSPDGVWIFETGNSIDGAERIAAASQRMRAALNSGVSDSRICGMPSKFLVIFVSFCSRLRSFVALNCADAVRTFLSTGQATKRTLR